MKVTSPFPNSCFFSTFNLFRYYSQYSELSRFRTQLWLSPHLAQTQVSLYAIIQSTKLTARRPRPSLRKRQAPSRPSKHSQTAQLGLWAMLFAKESSPYPTDSANPLSSQLRSPPRHPAASPCTSCSRAPRIAVPSQITRIGCGGSGTPCSDGECRVGR
jgi:hypothetical protein